MPNVPHDIPPPHTLVLDLENTLVGSTWDRKYGWRHAKRPGVEKFLHDMVQYYEIVLYSPSHEGLAEPVVAALDKDGCIMHRLYREATHFHNGIHVKDLNSLNRNVKRIVVLDDDQVYPKKLVETYLKESNELPDASFCQVGWKVPKSFDHADRVQYYGAKFRLKGQKPPVKKREEIEILQGASSYAVKPKFFDQEISDYESAPKEARFVDDIWFSGLLAKRNVKKYVVPGLFKYCRLSNAKTRSGTGLVNTANKAHDNNNKLYQYFEDYWKLYD